MGRLKQAIFKFKPFSKKQLKVLTWWLPDSPVSDKDGIIADGAIRSGKTLSMSLSFVIWAVETFDSQNFGMCGKTIGSFRRNVLFWLKLMLLSRGYAVADHRADNLLTASKAGKTNYFYIFGGKDERSQDLIQGITLAGVFFDEVSLMPESFVNQATGRCSVEGSKFWFNCNPDGPFHWFNVNWIKKANLKNLLYLHFTMDDNLSLSEKIKARYQSMYSGVFYDRYIRGLWVVAKGIIYDMFSKAANVVETVERAYTQFYIAVDYGTQNATVFGLFGLYKDKWYMVKEYYHSGRDSGVQKTDSQYADDLEEFIENYPVTQVVVDPSAASFKAELKQRQISTRDANNDVLNGIRLTGSLLLRSRLFINDCCKNTISEFESYRWDEKATLTGEDKPLKERDHSMDMIRYFCYTILRKHYKGR